MKAIQFATPRVPVYTDFPEPSPDRNEVLVRIEAVNTCPHWDMHLMNDEEMLPGMPLTYPYPVGQPGHEATGVVERIGTDVTVLEPGMRVAAWRDPGQDRPGSYAQYNVYDVDNLVEVPASLPAEKVASLELAMCVQVSFDRLLHNDLVQGKRFAVSGLGPAGIVALQMARAYGAAEVIGIEPVAERRHAAITLGFDRVYSPDSVELLEIRRGSDNAFDSAIDCTGFKQSIEFLMDRTTHAVSIFGVLREDLVFASRHWSKLALLGYEPHNRSAAKRALAAVIGGQIDLAPLVTTKLPLSRYVEGVKLLMEKKATKVCYLPWDD